MQEETEHSGNNRRQFFLRGNSVFAEPGANEGTWMELEKVAGILYRELPGSAEKLSRELERLNTLLTQTGAAVMIEIEKEKYRRDRDPDHMKQLRRIYRVIRREADSIESCRAQFQEEHLARQEQREHGAAERIDYDRFRVDENIAYTLDTVFTNKKPAAFSLCGQKVPVDSWKQMLLQTCAMLNRMDPMLFASLEHDPDLIGRKRPYFSRDGLDMDTPAKVPDADLYVETHVSARYLKKMIRNLLQKYSIPQDEYLIYLKKDFTALHGESTQRQRQIRTEEGAPQRAAGQETEQAQQMSFTLGEDLDWN